MKIQLLGVNLKGQEPGNASATQGRTAPWLQDGDADANGRSDVWDDLWNVTWRDVVVLDGSNTKVSTYNLTQHDLAQAANYSQLREMLVDAAMQSQKPWRNPADRYDVTGNGSIEPLDVLRIINKINADGSHELPPPTNSPPPYYDVSGDGSITPQDALLVINELNRRAVSTPAPEGEAASAAAWQDAVWAAWPENSSADLAVDSRAAITRTTAVSDRRAADARLAVTSGADAASTPADSPDPWPAVVETPRELNAVPAPNSGSPYQWVVGLGLLDDPASLTLGLV